MSAGSSGGAYVQRWRARRSVRAEPLGGDGRWPGRQDRIGGREPDPLLGSRSDPTKCWSPDTWQGFRQFTRRPRGRAYDP